MHAHAIIITATDTRHSHAPASFGRTFAIATALNIALVAAQVVYGLYANSLALLADAGHNFGDVMGLVIAWVAFAIADWRPSARFTYRMRAASILSAMANGLLLLVAVGIIVYEAVLRLFAPEPVATTPVIIVAAVGRGHQRPVGLAVEPRQQIRPQHARRFPAHAGRYRRLGGGDRRRLRHHADRLAMARPGGQPVDLGRHSDRHLAAAARLAAAVAQRRAARHRSGRRCSAIWRACRRSRRCTTCTSGP